MVFLHNVLGLASIHCRHILTLKRLAVLARIEHAAAVHRALQAVALPAKHVISVRAPRMTLLIAVAEHERVAAILGPHVLEHGGVPERLVGELRHADGVGFRACGAGGKTGGLRIVHVSLVVGGVEVNAVPAARAC